MAFALNLRFDLARLGNKELAAKLDEAWRAYDEAKSRRQWSGLVWSRRGPIRHPRAYRFLAVLDRVINADWFGLVLATFMSGKKTEGFIRSDRAVAMHLNLCEICDIMDEMNRRIDRTHA